MQRNVVRLLDLGQVPYLRSQTIYHAVADAMDEDSPDTIILMSPREAYVCVGYHQDLEQDVDLDYCRAHGLPVLRRQIGGGTVYLDGDQLFYHCIVHRQRAPRRVEDIYRRYLRGPIEAYRQLGVAARLCSMNDIIVEERKIGGTGAGSIGDAVVVCGSMIFGFDTARMSGLLRAPSESFRRQVEAALGRYMTSLRNELGFEPPRDQVRDALVDRFAEALEVEIQPGELTERERVEIEQQDDIFLQAEWLHSISRPHPPVKRVKIRAGAFVLEARAEHEGHYARATATVVDGNLTDLDLEAAADCDKLRAIEAAFLGQALKQEAIAGMLPLLNSHGEKGAAQLVQACLTQIEQEVRDPVTESPLPLGEG